MRNYSVIGQGIGMIGLQPDTGTIAAQQQLHFQQVISNQFILDAENTGLSIDVESYNTEVFYRLKRQQFEFALQLNLLAYSRGFLDSSIERFHDLFGMPNGGREFVKQNQYSIAIDGDKNYLFDSPSSGLGDTRLLARYHFHPQHSLISQIKLPTESEQEFGSGSTDLAIALRHSWPVANFAWHAQYGVVWVGERSWLNDNKADFVAQLSAALEAKITARHSINFQLDMHSRLYKSASELYEQAFFNDAATASISYQYSGQEYQFQAAFLEDIIVESSPDISFLFSINKSFDIHAK